ncbi:MAG: class I SAM-dependent methyltransferase [Verrucomicrobia bacterium]|nr:class I SAM-dependent methyltransferase [Verrucomicrobiota bacterium]
MNAQPGPTSSGKSEPQFDALAADYAHYRRALPGTRLYLSHLHEVIFGALGPLKPDARVLDLMSGHGDLGADLAEKWGCQVVGLDISTALLEKNPCRFLTCGDALRLPFSSGVFDGVVVCGGLHHLKTETLGAALAEILRVMKANACLSFFEPTDDFPMAALLRKYFYDRLEYLGDRAEEHIFYRPDVARVLWEAGFRDVRVRPFGWAGYALLSQTDAAWFLRGFARSPWLARTLIALEKVWQSLPLVSRMAFGAIGSARKPPDA